MAKTHRTAAATQHIQSAISPLNIPSVELSAVYAICIYTLHTYLSMFVHRTCMKHKFPQYQKHFSFLNRSNGVFVKQQFLSVLAYWLVCTTNQAFLSTSRDSVCRYSIYPTRFYSNEVPSPHHVIEFIHA